MFGFIYFLSTLFGSGIEHLRRNKATNDSKKRCTEMWIKGENPCGVYFDWQGHERDIHTGKKVIVWREKGHTIVKEVGGPVLRDITQAQNNQRIMEAIKNGAIVIKVFDGINDSERYKGVVDEWERRTGQKWRMADNQPKLDQFDSVYVHCKTKRYCVIREMRFNKVFGKGTETYEINKNAKNFYVKYYVDIHTDEVLDRVANGPMIEDNGIKREMTLEEEQEGIKKYQELKRKGLLDITKGNIGYKHPLAALLPMTCEDL